jgi:hypothetical protein
MSKNNEHHSPTQQLNPTRTPAIDPNSSPQNLINITSHLRPFYSLPASCKKLAADPLP